MFARRRIGGHRLSHRPTVRNAARSVANQCLDIRALHFDHNGSSFFSRIGTDRDERRSVNLSQGRGGQGHLTLPELEALMKRYADRPMDFADATLVHLARREPLNVVFTVDHDDFETYRIEGRKRFRIVPDC
jgi:hypothetical protein